MKVSIKISRSIPLGVEEIELEDVASYEVSDTQIKVKYNIGDDEVIVLSSDKPEEWFHMHIEQTKIGLTMEEEK